LGQVSFLLALGWLPLNAKKHVECCLFQILFSDYPNDIAPLLVAYDRIPYDGSGKVLFSPRSSF